MKKIGILMFVFLCSVCCYSADMMQPVKELKDTIADIQSLNLIVGLHLTRTQMMELLRINNKIEEAFKTREKKIRETLKTYKEFKEGLIRNGFELDKKLMVRTGELHRDEKDFMEGFKNLQQQCFVEATEVLTDAQKKVMQNYRACLLPTNDLKNPARIGQADRSSHFVNILRKARNAPDDKIEEMIENFWAKAEKKMKKKLKNEEEIKKHKELLGEVVAEARNMTEAEFELNKESLIEKLVLDKPAVEKNPDKARFLVRPGMVSIYEKLLAGK